MFNFKNILISNSPCGLYLTLGFTSLFLASCGGSSSSNEPIAKANKYPAIQMSTPQSDAKLTQQSEQSNTEARLKNGLLQQANHYFLAFNERDGGINTITNEALPAQSPLSTSQDNGNYTQTNTITANVDEADLVKYDGLRQTLFIAVTENSLPLEEEVKASASMVTTAAKIATSIIAEPYYSEQHSYVRIMQMSDKMQMKEVAKINAQNNNEDNNTQALVQALYLDEQTLTVFKDLSSYRWWDIALVDESQYSSQFQNGSFAISQYDVSEVSDPLKNDDVEISGYLINSRRIGDKLYVLSQFTPQYQDDYITYPQSDTQYQSNLAQVSALTPEQLMPSISINNQTPVMLGNIDHCYVPTDDVNHAGYPAVMSITVFDLTDLNQYQSTCLNIQTHGFYLSEQALYLTHGNYTDDTTRIHKFNLTDDSVQYAASANLPGHLGWRSESFKMHEKDNLLRVVTSTYEDNAEDWIDHQLWVLQTNSTTQTLEPIAKLPNETYPQALGKDNEDIYAVRFFNDRAYLVTFEQIDPLYVIDLSEANNPKIAGELEIPGFSSYLHPLGENYLLGIGEDTNVNEPLLEFDSLTTSNLSSTTTMDTAEIENGEGGIKVALFDVANMQSPQLVDQVILGNRFSWSAALYDHKAVSLLKTDDTHYKLALPAYLNKHSGLAIRGDNVNFFALNLIDISTETSRGNLNYTGFIKAESDENGGYANFNTVSRGIIHDNSSFGDLVHFVHTPYVYSTTWQNSGSVIKSD